MVSEEKVQEVALDALDALDEERLAAIEAQTADDECHEAEHCFNDCNGYYDEDSGEYDDPEDCVHCGCCYCTPCSYARVA